MKPKIYISGKITGMEDEAKILFEKAEAELIEKGFEVVNPMKLNHDHDKSWKSYMRVCVDTLFDCDYIYMLDNWQLSRGAKIEYNLAYKLGYYIHFSTVQTLKP